MRRVMRAAAAVIGVLIAVTALTSCAAAEKTVDHTASSATVQKGETLVVDFGSVNPSVGDEWVITTEPDPSVLGEGDAVFTSDAPEDMAGAPSDLVYKFATKGAGTTTIAWEYRFRGAVPEDPDDQKTAEITVTVK